MWNTWALKYKKNQRPFQTEFHGKIEQTPGEHRKMENTAFVFDWTCKRYLDGLATEIFVFISKRPCFYSQIFF